MKKVFKIAVKLLKRAVEKHAEWFCWMHCSEVLEAINNGCEYEEVNAVVRACMKKEFGRTMEWVAKEDT